MNETPAWILGSEHDEADDTDESDDTTPTVPPWLVRND
jgi:hypothetical protein